MRAVVYDRYGPPEVLRLEDVPPPTPADDEVLVRIVATTVNRTDCATRAANRGNGAFAQVLSRSTFGVRRPRRHILGTEYAGRVEAVGSAVQGFAVGDPVFGATGLRFGTHAELVAVRADGAIAKAPAVPSGIDLADLAAVCDGGINVLTSLQRVGLHEGQRILVHGASGSIGTAAVQLAKHFGADVTAVCGTRNLELARSLGADRVIDYTRDDFTQNGETYDVVFDAVGKKSFDRCRGSLRKGGTFIATDGLQNALFGVVSRFTDKRAVFPIPKLTKANVEELARLVEAGEYRPVIDRRHPLEEVVEATRYVETERKTGNVILTVADEAREARA